MRSSVSGHAPSAVGATPTPYADAPVSSSPTVTASPALGTPLPATNLLAETGPTQTTRPRPTPRPATPTPKPAAVARAPRKGTLTIWVNGGWAAVSIDGRSLEQNAPIVGYELVEGKHRILLENGAAKFRREYDVTIVPGEEARLGVTLPP